MTTTTLEQSKKLKELGMVDSPTLVWIQLKHELTDTKNWDTWNLQLTSIVHKASPLSDYNIVSAYTLDELIEWLGDDYFNLDRSGSDWWATNSYLGEEQNTVAKGGSPLDAVYNLAIAVKGGTE